MVNGKNCLSSNVVDKLGQYLERIDASNDPVCHRPKGPHIDGAGICPGVFTKAKLFGSREPKGPSLKCV